MPLYRSPANSGAYKQTVNAKLAADFTTTSSTFVTVLTANITTTGGNLNIFACISSSNSANGGQNFYRITCDAVSVGAASCKGDLGTLSGTIVESSSIVANVTGLTAGAHTVLLQARRSAGTLQIRPITAAVDEEFCNLLIQEVIV